MMFIGIIPARYASSRFPGKPLVNIAGKSMIQRVYEQACKAKTLSKVFVATDNEQIFEHIKTFSENVVMTAESHPSGTDRCLEAANNLGIAIEASDVIVNIQGDEPFIDPIQIDLLTRCFEDQETGIATLIKKINSTEELLNASKPKVILNKKHEAIYFSRSPIPHLRGKAESEWINHFTYYSHIGIYAYRFEILKQITKLQPSELEVAESLEQLRWIEHGYGIKTAVTDIESMAVDTPDDLQKILKAKFF